MYQCFILFKGIYTKLLGILYGLLCGVWQLISDEAGKVMRWLCLCRSFTRTKRRKFRLFVSIGIFGFILWICIHYNDSDKSVRAERSHRTKGKESNDILYNVIRNLAEFKDQVCVHPELDPFHSSVIGFFHDVPPLECKEEKDWIIVENGTFFISPEAKAKHGSINCQYVPIYRGGDDYKIKNGKKETFQDGIIIAQSDFFKISCKAQDGERYFNVHATVATVENPQLNFQTNSQINTSSAIPLNVFIFGYDSVSRNTWKRKLPNTHEYFTNVLGGVVLEGYNIVGDGTPQALLPLLTGKTEAELPESRRGKPDAKPVDEYPWIWKKFQAAGYKTQWAEDMAHIGTFNFRMLGFKEQPVHHYMRPFYLASEKIYSFNKPYCLGSLNRHKTMINWFRDGFTMYHNQPKFMFGFHSEFSHKDSNTLQWADDDLLRFLTFLSENRYLQNTLLILMSDHGARFHDVRKTLQGKYEERMPYFALRFPDWFINKYPKMYAKFLKNAKRLTTPFDIHETFLDLLYFNYTINTKGTQRGISLLRRIPKDRKCEDAGISSHWCACLNWNTVSKTDGAVQRSANSVLKFINTLTKKFRQKCHHLVLQNISNAQSISANPNIIRYRGSNDLDGRNANFSKYEMPQHVLYQITIMTLPGNAVYEATVRYDRKSDDYRVNEREISRINAYGNSADCIINTAPHLRQYCYCTG